MLEHTLELASSHASMSLREEQPPSAAAQLQTSSREPTLAPSTVENEKEVRSTVSSRGQQGSGSGSSSSSFIEGGAPVVEHYHPEKAEDLAKVQTARSDNGNKLQPTETREDGTEYPTGVKLTLISAALCLSVFLIALE